MRCLALLLMLACDPADVGVVLPQGGPDAVTADDLRRDLWTYTDPRIGGRAPGSSGARRVAQAVAQQFQRAHLRPAFGDGYQKDLGAEHGELVCGVRPGGGAGAVAVVALDPGVGVMSAVPIAGLVALTRAFDGVDSLDRTFIFCLLPESGGLDGYVAHPPHPLSTTSQLVILGSLTGQVHQRSAGPSLAGISSEIWHTGPLAPELADDMGRLDYEAVVTQVRTVFSKLTEHSPASGEQ